MARKSLFDLSTVDLQSVEYGLEEIRRLNPHRHEMELLHGVIQLDLKRGRAIGFKEVRDDEFWVRGHFPDRPLLPGVLIVEAMAQLCYFFYKKRFDDENRILGFTGLEEVRFRGAVSPGERLLLLMDAQELRRRRATFRTQALVGERIVFEGVIVGMPLQWKANR